MLQYMHEDFVVHITQNWCGLFLMIKAFVVDYGRLYFPAAVFFLPISIISLCMYRELIFFCRSVYFYYIIIAMKCLYIYYICIWPEYIVMNYLLIIQWSLFSSWMRLFCSICTVLYKMLLNYDVHSIIVCCILFITLISIYVRSLFEFFFNLQVFRCIFNALFMHVRLHLHVCLLWIENFPIIVNVRHVMYLLKLCFLSNEVFYVPVFLDV